MNKISIQNRQKSLLQALKFTIPTHAHHKPLYINALQSLFYKFTFIQNKPEMLRGF